MLTVIVLLVLALILSLLFNLYLARYIMSDDEPTTEDINRMVYEQLEAMLADDGREETEVRVAIHENIAYWLSGDGIYHAPLDDDQEVIHDEARPLDVDAIDDQQAQLLMEILDALKEGQ
jgi:uncharacterized protein YneF (UPF0154 family)